MASILILNYHDVFHAKGNCAVDPVYGISRTVFCEQLEIIKASGRKVISVRDALQDPRQNGIVLTFDDANDSDSTIVYPLLKKYGFTATFCIPGSALLNNPVKTGFYQQIAREGFGIMPHGMTHRYLDDLSPEEQEEEIVRSCSFIETLTGEKADFFALPGGKFDRYTIAAARKHNLKGILSTKFGIYRPGEFLIDRWTIRKRLPQDRFERIIEGDRFTMALEEQRSGIKKMIQQFIPNRLVDTLNYRLH